MTTTDHLLGPDAPLQHVKMGQLTVLTDVLRELQAQDAKWGRQTHPDGTGAHRRPLRGVATAYADRTQSPIEMAPSTTTAHVLQLDAKAWNDRRAAIGDVTWADILLEELFEALAEPPVVGGPYGSPADTPLRTELIQVAAVALQWALAIDRRFDDPRVEEL